MTPATPGRPGTACAAAAPREARLAAGALALAVVASFVSGPLIAATAPTPAVAVAFWRLALAALALAPWGMGRAPRPAGLSRGRVTRLAAASALALAAHFFCWITALRLTSIAAAATLVNATPLALVALEYLAFGQLPARRQWGGIALALAGVCLISRGDWSVSGRALAGDGLALGGALTYALYLVAGRALRPALGALRYNLTVFAQAALALAVLAAATHIPLVGFPLRVWLLLGALAAAPTLLGHALANYSLGRLTATTVGLAYLLEPVGATAIGYLWLHQVPTAAEVGGGIITLAGLALYLGVRAPIAGGASDAGV
jgi:drug/metabolite transporter (DMT)-like permease